MPAMQIHEARRILNRWVNFGHAGWSQSAGYLEIVAIESETAFHRRVNALPYYQRAGQQIQPDDTCSLKRAKRLVHHALLLMSAEKSAGDWVQPYWNHLRKHGVPGEDSLQ